jgi:uncharacterized protein YjdB
VRDARGEVIPGRSVMWSSEDASIADVSSSGVVTGRRVGRVMVAASALGKDAFSIVTVNPTPVSSVRLSHANQPLRVGEVLQLSADALDAGGRVLTGRPITWSSSSVDVASVTGDGLVTAVAPGGAVITASVEGKSAAASVTVSLVPVTSVAIEPNVSDLVVGQNTQLTAEVRDASSQILSGRVVTWTTSRAQVATVSSSGVVTAIAQGSATISATSEGRTGAATVNVSPRPVSAVIVSPNQVSVTVGQATQLNVSITDSQGQILTGRPVAFTSSNAQVASVSSSGVVTGVSTGTATITATSEGRTGTTDVTVTPQPVASVSVTPSPASVTVGNGIQLTATPRNAAGQPLTGRTVSWRSGAPGLASVSTTGFVTGLAPGTAVIIATVDGIAGSGTIGVGPVPVAAVQVTPAAASVDVGLAIPLSVTALDASGNILSGRVVSWSSSAPSIATVAAGGVVTGVAAGTTTITATVEGKTGNSTVTVNATAASVASVEVSPITVQLSVGGTQPVTATPRDAAGNPLTGRVVTWASADANVATVTTAGVITATGVGSATITATSEGQTGVVDVTVAAASVASVTVAPTPVSINVAWTVAMTATALDASGNPMSASVAWTTSDPSVAVVSSAGVVRGISPGSATIIASSGAAIGTATVNVQLAPVSRVVISPSNPTLNSGKSVQLTATLYDALNNVLTGRTVAWSSADASKLTVDQNGLAHGLKKGTVRVTATSEGSSGSTDVRVK